MLLTQTTQMSEAEPFQFFDLPESCLSDSVLKTLPLITLVSYSSCHQTRPYHLSKMAVSWGAAKSFDGYFVASQT